jgi:hypothetical protein
MEGCGSTIFSFKVQFLECDGFGNRGWTTQSLWLEIPLPVDKHVRQMFEASVSINLGDGASAEFRA